MFEYPLELPLKELDVCHPDYEVVSPEYRRIDLLASGGHRLRQVLPEFLPQRSGEEGRVYRERLSKFSYAPTLGDALRGQAARLKNGSVVLEDVASREAFWGTFRENLDGAGLTEKQLVSDLYTKTAKAKKVFVHVDREASEVIPRNALEESLFLSPPKLVVYGADEVIAWGDDWIKVRQLEVVTSSPLSQPRMVAVWTLIDSQKVTRYSAYVRLDPQGNIKKILTEQGKIAPRQVVPMVSQVIHNVGVLPVICCEVPDFLWVGDKCSAAALEHLRISCHRYDFLTQALLQRYYKRTSSPMGVSEMSNWRVDETPQVGLEYVNELESFDYAEPQGNIITHLTATLRELKSDIRAAVDLAGASESQTTLEQSGVSKELDYSSLGESLKTYGQLITDWLQDIYGMVLLFQGETSEDLSVSGLDNFQVDSTGSLIERLSSIASIDPDSLRANLPETAVKALIVRLCDALEPNASQSRKEELRTEIEIWTGSQRKRTPVEQSGM